MIKPYFNFHSDVKNLNSYRELLKKRLTKPQQFKFTMIREQDEFTRDDEKQIQLKFLNALRIVKPVSKIDLGECEITDFDFWEPKLLSSLKTTSKVKTLFVMGPKSGCQMNYFKYFPKLKNVFYKLNSYSYYPDSDNFYKTEERPDTHYDLKSLKYCPRIRSLGFADFSGDYYSPKVVVEPNRYLRSLESLVLSGERRTEDHFEFPLESCKNLRSISLQFPRIWSWESLPRILDLLSKLANLQEIHLSWMGGLGPDSLKAFRKITKKGILQKVRFEFDDTMNEVEALLKALKTCKLTSFYLEVYLEGALIKAISQFIKSMGHLESLQLHIFSNSPYSKDENFMELCKQISQLQALRNLKLCFQTRAIVSKKTRISNFIPSLSNAFTKPVKIETFHFECHQIESSQALQSLTSILENSAAFLTHLKIDVGALPCTSKTFRSILKLMQSLVNIQVLEVPCLAVSGSTSHFLNVMANTVHELKDLRSLVIGVIKDNVFPSDLYNAVETISSKRGLRQFDCQLSYHFQNSLRNEEDLQDLDLDRIFQKNPYLENFTLANNFSSFYFDIYRWIEH